MAGIALHYAIEPEPLDTAGAIRFAAHSVGATDERLIVVNGDVLTDLDLTSLVEFHEQRGGEATIHLTPVEDPPPSAFGVVPTDDAGRVLAFIEKPSRESAPTNAINAGDLRARAGGAREDRLGSAGVDRTGGLPGDGR